MAIGVINIMKKVFVKPEMEVLEIERTTIIAESGEYGTGEDSNDGGDI